MADKNDENIIKIMYLHIKEKIRSLLVEKQNIEAEIEKWQLVEEEIQRVEDELSLLQSKTISLGHHKDNEKESENLKDQIQNLLHKQSDIYWDALSYGERLEYRWLNFITFKKQRATYSEDRYAFELILNRYTEYLLDIINHNKKIWWSTVPSRDRLLGVLKEELMGILHKRNEVKLLPEETIGSIIRGLSRPGVRFKFLDEEWLNLQEFSELFGQVQVLRRENVYFF